MADTERTERRAGARSYRAIDLALRIGEVVMASGAGAADTAATMLTVTNAGGLYGCAVDVTFTTLTISYQGEAEEPASAHTRQVTYRGLDYHRLTGVDQLVRDLGAGRVDLDEARRRLARLQSTAGPYPRWSMSLGWGAMAGSAAILIGGSPVAALIAFLSAAVIDVLNRRTSRRRLPVFYQQVYGGFLATVVAVVAAPLIDGVSASMIVAAGIFVLLGGITIVGSLQDALSGFYVTAAARTFEALLLTGGIIGGVTGGLSLAARLDVEVAVSAVAPRGLEYLPVACVAAAGVSAAFAFATAAPVRALLPAGMLGVIGQLVYRPIVAADFGAPWGSAVAAVVVGMLSYSLAGRFRVPPLVVVVAGISPLLPGLAIYRGLFQLSQSDVAGVLSLVTAITIAVALAAGVIFGEYVAQPLRREARRLESRLAGPRLVGPLRQGRDRARSALQHAAHPGRPADTVHPQVPGSSSRAGLRRRRSG